MTAEEFVKNCYKEKENMKKIYFDKEKETYVGEQIKNIVSKGVSYEEVKENNGKCYLAIDNNVVVGLIMGCLRSYDEYDYLDYKCPRCGKVTELIVSKKTRSKGIGSLLMNKMEEYFKSVGCEYVIVDVFAYNDIGKNFYNKKDYHERMKTMIKKI